MTSLVFLTWCQKFASIRINPSSFVFLAGQFVRPVSGYSYKTHRCTAATSKRLRSFLFQRNARIRTLLLCPCHGHHPRNCHQFNFAVNMRVPLPSVPSSGDTSQTWALTINPILVWDMARCCTFQSCGHFCAWTRDYSPQNQDLTCTARSVRPIEPLLMFSSSREAVPDYLAITYGSRLTERDSSIRSVCLVITHGAFFFIRIFVRQQWRTEMKGISVSPQIKADHPSSDLHGYSYRSPYY